jgi:hypothetical protein
VRGSTGRCRPRRHRRAFAAPGTRARPHATSGAAAAARFRTALPGVVVGEPRSVGHLTALRSHCSHGRAGRAVARHRPGLRAHARARARSSATGSMIQTRPCDATACDVRCMKRGSGAIQPNAKPISSTKRTPPTPPTLPGRNRSAGDNSTRGGVQGCAERALGSVDRRIRPAPEPKENSDRPERDAPPLRSPPGGGSSA